MLKENIIITDIGSTTTKALFLKKNNNSYQFVDYATAYTTVEKPEENVLIGLYNSIKGLEQKLGFEILEPQSETDKLQFKSNFSYLTTSSAGGGLQILVIGLTKFDSAASAERAAYGVGGVLLETLAIDDKRSTIDKMKLINTLHPDIILFSGGVEGGALFSVYRMAEILKLAKPSQKFTPNAKIPLVFAGNSAASEYIQSLFSERFELHISPNLRPTMKEENLEPVKEKIHELFMNSVMEQAPGYPKVKKIVDSDIIPTPVGVLNTLKILGKNGMTAILFDIGGATTDIFSNAFGHHHRTVSANFGMSYSIGNILASADYDHDFAPYLPQIPNIKEYFQNYVGNKVLYPIFNPETELDKLIEYIIAIKGIKLAVSQHFKMHFNTASIGILERLKELTSRDKWVEKMYHPYFNEVLDFKMSDINVAIGAGGVISHANKESAIFLLAESFAPVGVTELWRDKHFISPHLGVLSVVDEAIAEEMILNSCFEKLAIHVKPIFRKTNFKTEALKVIIDNVDYPIQINDVFYFKGEKPVVVRFVTNKHCFIPDRNHASTKTPFMQDSIHRKEIPALDSQQVIKLEANIPLIVDTRNSELGDDKLLKKLNLYNIDCQLKTAMTNVDIFEVKQEEENNLISPIHYQQQQILPFKLPYSGTVLVKAGDKVEPDTLIAENKLEPPRIFVVILPALVQSNLTEEQIRKNILIKENDIVAAEDLIYKDPTSLSLFNNAGAAYSPVRGVVEKINYESGSIIIREIQDYSHDPVKVNLAKELQVKNKNIKGYMKKQLGEFVYAGDILASNMQNGVCKLVKSPYSGNITEINPQTGSVMICYLKKPHQIFAQCFGEVVDVIENEQVDIAFTGNQINGKIGFSKDRGGYLKIYELDASGFDNSIIYTPHISTLTELNSFTSLGINGMIVNTMSYTALKGFLGKDIGVA